MVDKDIYELIKGFAMFDSEISYGYRKEIKYKKMIIHDYINNMEYNKTEEFPIDVIYYYDIIDWLKQLHNDKYELYVWANKDRGTCVFTKVKRANKQ